MKYLLLLNNEASEWDRWRTLSKAEAAAGRAEEIPRWNQAFAWAAEQQIELDGLELEDPSGARVVTRRNGETIVTDGPFAETKEVLGGYFVADCTDLDQAIELARRIPVVEKGSVEIRPLVEE